MMNKAIAPKTPVTARPTVLARAPVDQETNENNIGPVPENTAVNPFPGMMPDMPPSGPNNMLGELRAEFPNLQIVPVSTMLNLQGPGAGIPFEFTLPDQSRMVRLIGTTAFTFSFKGRPQLAAAYVANGANDGYGEGLLVPAGVWTSYYYSGGNRQISFVSPTANVLIGIEIYLADRNRAF